MQFVKFFIPNTFTQVASFGFKDSFSSFPVKSIYVNEHVQTQLHKHAHTHASAQALTCTHTHTQ